MSPVMWARENPVWSTADRSNCYHCRFKHSLRYLIKMRPSLLLCSNSLWFVHKWVCTVLAKKKKDFYCLLWACFWFGLVYSHTTVLRDGICKTEVSCKALCLEVALSEKKKRKRETWGTHYQRSLLDVRATNKVSTHIFWYQCRDLEIWYLSLP